MSQINLGTINMVATGITLSGRTPGNGSAQSALYLYGNSDDSCTYFGDPSSVPTFTVTVVDPTGAATYYVAYKNTSDQIASITPLYGNWIVITAQGQSYIFAARNLKLNNATKPILIVPTPEIFAQNPCPAEAPGATLKYVFLNSQVSVIACAYYNAFMESDNVYTAIFKVGGNGEIFATDNFGYCGNTLVTDPFYKLGTSLPPGYSQTAIGTLSNGQSSLLMTKSSVVAVQTVVVGINQGGYLAGQLPCCNPPSECAFDTGTFVFTESVSDLFTNLTTSNTPFLADSIMPGVSGVEASTEIQYQAGPNLSFLALLNAPGAENTPCVTVTPNQIWCAGFTGALGGTGYEIFRAANDGLIYPGSEIINNPTHYSVNDARPISLTGMYKS